MSGLSSASCPVKGCSTIIKATSIKVALRHMDSHLRSVHPGFVRPKGSMQDRVPRLD